MPTTFSTSPHFDDYDETKQFVRVLFRPGRAVQARELTQLQTIIQAQIERFGKGVYKDGSFVSPPKTTYDNTFSFVKLTESTGATNSDDVISGLVGTDIINSDGVKALIINHAVSTTAGDPPTLFVKYKDGGTNKSLTFSDGDTLTSGSTTLTALSSSSVGNGTAFSVGQCTIFARGNFLFVPEQTHVVEKYSTVTNKLIGFSVTESVVDSDDDTSLLDPASGTFNFFAPGADRYKANLTLTSRALNFTDTSDTNFIEVVRVENGEVIKKEVDPKFSVLGDALAKRTFEESGNYEVEPFILELREHLRQVPIGSNTSANITATVNTGVFPKANGGDNTKFVSVVTPGKAFVKGYRVEDVNSRFVTIDKARNFANVTNGVVASHLSSFVTIDSVNALPDLAVVETINLRDSYMNSNAGQNGTIVGTAKARGLVYKSGNVAHKKGAGPHRTAEFKLHLFDVNMNDGKTFDRNVKQIEAEDFEFASNIVPTLTNLSGAVTFNDASTTIRGSGTRFTIELKVGDTFSVSNTQTTNKLVVNSITDDVTLTVSSAATINLQEAVEVTYVTPQLNTANIGDSDKDVLISQFPFDVIKAVDPDNDDTTYTVKRQETRSLTSGAVTITAGTNETFSPFSSDNYLAVIVSGVRKGEYIEIQSGTVSFNGGFTEVTFDFSGDESLTSEAIEFILTVNKKTSAALRKTKTLTQNQTITINAKKEAQEAIISLGKADVVRLANIKMSNVAFGTSYDDDGAMHITDRYTLDTNQKSTFYDLSKIELKPGAAKPEHPIKITFDFFSHGTGDFFSVGSYPDYENIPTVEFAGKQFNLRNCLDFRPRINDDGTGFSGTGASTTEFFDPEINFTTDYEYFLPKISSIGINELGNYFLVDGKSELNPREPSFPADLIKLFVLQQKPYVFNLNNDIEVKKVENKRFTMKDIGKIENRVKTLEFYTTLNLLERDAQQTQIQDDLGFERFKNGFVVDSFTGHGVGDSKDNPDYAVSVNFTKKEASPLIKSEFINMKETSSTLAQRASNNYVITGSVASLPYTHEVLVQNPFSSKTQNLNPFNIGVFQGVMKLSPPGDLWFDDKRVPDVQVDRTGTFDSLTTQSLMKRDGRNVFGSLNDIEQLRNGIPQNTDELPENLKGLSDLLGSVSPATSSLQLQGNEIVKNIVVVPKMRDAFINIQVDGMRPNTRVYGFFDNQSISPFLSPITAEIKTLQTNLSSNIAAKVGKAFIRKDRRDLANAMSNVSQVLSTDNTGSIEVNFQYTSETMNLDTGKKLLRLSSSSKNNIETEVTFGEQMFVSDGVIREISKEVLRPVQPEPVSSSQISVEEIQIDDSSTGTTILERVYSDIRGNGHFPRKFEVDYWEEHFPGISSATDASTVANIGGFFQSFAQGATTHGEQDRETKDGVADQAGESIRNGHYDQKEAEVELADDFHNKYL